MNYIHYNVQTMPGDTILVSLKNQARVLLLDATNFNAYRCGRQFHHYGGWATASPARLSPPCAGHWHVVVDLNGRVGSIQAGVQVIRCA